jgi:predicted  nucleic acid-binding Zn-ribbon protein
MPALDGSIATSSPQPTGYEQLACLPSPTQDVAMEHRLTRLEVTTQHIQDDLRDLRTEVGDFKVEMCEFKGEMREFKVEMREFKGEMREFKVEMREFKSEMRDFQKEVRSEFRDVRHQARTDFRLLFGAIISLAVGMAALMAKGFHWV